MTLFYGAYWIVHKHQEEFRDNVKYTASHNLDYIYNIWRLTFLMYLFYSFNPNEENK